MRIGIKPSALKQTRGRSYLLRFVFGGLITALTGLIAQKWGPTVGGLFLAFPAILPASLTLIEKQEDQNQSRGRGEGKNACGVDAAGAALGSLGLLAFGGVVWGLASRLTAWQMLPLALLAWLTVSLILWVIRQKV